MFTDPLADMLKRISKAHKAKFEVVDIPSSRLKAGVANLLKREGYIKDFKVLSGDNNKKILRISLRYDEQNRPVITGLKRVSRPGRRFYSRSDGIPKVFNGFGINILSTSKGVMTDKKARKMIIL